MRHGESCFNREGLFAGWADTDLTEQGFEEAKAAGRMLAENDAYPDVVFTSLLQRCIKTSKTVLDELNLADCPIHKSWKLNERSYGDLTGKSKAAMSEKFGVEQVRAWRKSYDQPPPPMSPDHEYHPSKLEWYKNVRFFERTEDFFSPLPHVIFSCLKCKQKQKNKKKFTFDS